MTLMNNLDVIVLTSGGGFGAKMLLCDTLGSFHKMVKFSGSMRILVHDDPIYLKPREQKGKIVRDNRTDRDRCLEFRHWLVKNLETLKIDKLIFSEEWQHIGGSIQKLMAEVKTPIYFHLEDDYIFLQELNFDELVECFRYDYVHAIRFNRGWNKISGWDRILKPYRIDGVELLATSSWSFNPSLVRAAKMREFIALSYIKQHHESETILAGAQHEEIKREGFDAAHRKWGSYIYGKWDEGPVITHIGWRIIDEYSSVTNPISEAPETGNSKAIRRLLPSGKLRILTLGQEQLGWSPPDHEIIHCDQVFQGIPGFIQANLDGHLPYKNKSFDGIIAMNVLEQLRNPLDFIRECVRLLRGYGFLLLSISNNMSSSLRWELERVCRQVGLSIVNQMYTKDERLFVKAIRNKSCAPRHVVRRTLTRGWRITSEPLGHVQVRFRFREFLEIKLKLRGALPLTQYTVGLNVYGADVPFFGTVTRFACTPSIEIHDGVSKTFVNSFVLGTMTTDVKGKRLLKVGFPVNPGTYDVQVWVSKKPLTAKATAICYKSGETFGDSNIIAIEPIQDPSHLY